LYVPDGVDTKLFTPAIVTKTEIDALKSRLGVANSKVCVYAGRIDWDIGGEILLKTIELLSKESGIKCLVLGEGEPDLIECMKKLSATVYVGLDLQVKSQNTWPSPTWFWCLIREQLHPIPSVP
jgi:glycosyltransferase involved in cell wall biosynthesis